MIDTLILERGKVVKDEECMYLIKLKNGKFYYGKCSMPQYETTLAKEFIDWLDSKTFCQNENLIGFGEYINNRDIEYYFNLTDIANKFKVNIDKINIQGFFEALRKVKDKNIKGHYLQVEWYMKYIVNQTKQ